MVRNKVYSIGEVSGIVGISTRTLRFYEETGLLAPARGANGYRRYTSEDIDRLQEILLLRHLGMGVAEIPSALSATEAGADVRSRGISKHSKTNASDSIPSSTPSNARSSTSRRESPWTIRRSSRA